MGCAWDGDRLGLDVCSFWTVVDERIACLPAAVGVVAHLTHMDIPRLVEVLQQAADSIRKELEDDH